MMSMTPRFERLTERRQDKILDYLGRLLGTDRRELAAKRWLLRLEGALT
jgi:hypothetical protein